jgi:hypothetical protein
MRRRFFRSQFQLLDSCLRHFDMFASLSLREGCELKRHWQTIPALLSLGAEQRLFPTDDLLGDCIGLARLTLGKVVHDVEHQAFHDRSQRPGSGSSRLRGRQTLFLV